MLSAYLLTIALMGEALLLMALYLIQLKRKITAARERENGVGGQLEILTLEPVGHENHLRYIEYEIKRTYSQLSKMQDAGESLENCKFVEWRVKFLSAEKECINASRPGNNQIPFWKNWLNYIRDQFPVSEECSSTATRYEMALQEIEILNKKNTAYEKRIKNMEHFKHLFLDLKEKFNDMQETHNGIILEVEKHLPEADRSRELKKLLTRIGLERTIIQHKLSTIRKECNSLFNTIGIHPVEKNSTDDLITLDLSNGIHSSIDIIENNIDQFKNLVFQQRMRIEKLNAEVKSLKHSPTESKNINNMTLKLSMKNEELGRLVTTLQKENSCLSDQIQLHMKSELENSQKLKEKLAEFSRKLIDKDMAYATLESEFLIIEKKYLELHKTHEGCKQAI